MQCPACEKYFSYEYIEDNDAEEGNEFSCPSCDAILRINVDEGTYCGAKHTTIEIVED